MRWVRGTTRTPIVRVASAIGGRFEPDLATPSRPAHFVETHGRPPGTRAVPGAVGSAGHDDSITSSIEASFDDSAVILAKDGAERHWRLENAGGEATLRSYVDADGDGAQSDAAQGTLVLGVWQHVAMTYDDAGDRTVRLYVDGRRSTTLSRSSPLESSTRTRRVRAPSTSSTAGSTAASTTCASTATP